MSDEIKCIVSIQKDNHPELYAELMKVKNPRARSERLRMLGTAFLRLGTFVNLTNQEKDKAETNSEAKKKKSDELIMRLGASIAKAPDP